jgi:hypothetical protein
MAQRDIESMTEDELFASWTEWIERSADELAEVYHHRFMFREVRRMFDTNPGLHTVPGQLVMDWLARLHGRDAMMFIRREYDSQPGTINTRQLLTEMEQRAASVLTRERYRRFYEHEPPRRGITTSIADTDFNRFGYVGDGHSPSDHVDPVGIAADRAALEAGTDTVRLVANRLVAHRTPEFEVPVVNVPDDLEGPLEAVRTCFDKYYVLLTGKSMSSPTPIIQFDWTDCFRRAWATDAYDAAWREERDQRGREQSQRALRSLGRSGKEVDRL